MRRELCCTVTYSTRAAVLQRTRNATVGVRPYPLHYRRQPHNGRLCSIAPIIDSIGDDTRIRNFHMRYAKLTRSRGLKKLTRPSNEHSETLTVTEVLNWLRVPCLSGGFRLVSNARSLNATVPVPKGTSSSLRRRLPGTVHTGSIPPELANLDHLQTLDICNNELEGECTNVQIPLFGKPPR